jgi:hypothetical protein
MTTEQQDTRNAYQYLMDSFALVEERGLSLSRAFYLLAHSDHQMLMNIKKDIKEIELLENSLENDDKVSCLEDLHSRMLGREATYMLISRFLDTDLFASIPSPYNEDECLHCFGFCEGEGE